MYLGAFKHEQAWPCLHEALGRLLPRRYLLHPRFRLDDEKGVWTYLHDEKVRQIMAQEGWKGLTGTIEPDILILDENGVIIQVFDLKFPCPGINSARWDTYKKGRWMYHTQGELYFKALGVEPRLVSPREGIVGVDTQ